MPLSDILTITAIVIFLLVVIYFVAEEHSYRKWLKDLEHPIDSFVIKEHEK